MTFRLRDDLFFPTPFIIDRFFDDDDLDIVKSFVRAFPNHRRQQLNQQQQQLQSGEKSTTASETESNNNTNANIAANKIDDNKLNSSTNGSNNHAHSSVVSRSSLLPLAFFNLDLIESDADYKVHVDLPGVDPADLDISIDNNRFLVIKAERKSVHEETDSKVQVHAVERVYGKTERKLRLPANADVENPESRLKNGVLTIVFGKKEKETVRKLSVQYE